MKEITYDELRELPKDTYELIDIRDDGLTAYGMIPGAVRIYVEDLESSATLADIPRNKKLVFYCQIGRMSREIDDTLDYLEGRDCYSLSEGYVGYIRYGVKSQADKEEKRKRAEESIQKKFHKQLLTKKLIAELKKTNPFIESNIFRSVENVNLDTVIEYKKNGVRHNFLDEY